MNRWLCTAAVLVFAGACDVARDAAAPAGLDPAALRDPALVALLATADETDELIVLVNFDERRTSRDAVTNAILDMGAGVVQFHNFSIVAALATPAQIARITELEGLEGAGVYANKQVQYHLLREGVRSIRADAVHTAGITGKGMGIAILDSGIDGLYNPDVKFPEFTVQNIKIAFNQRDVFTFRGNAPKPIKKGAELFVEDLPNSETSVGHGTHVAGIAAGRGTASNGYYTGVAPGASLVGIGAGDILFIFWILSGFDYILDNAEQYNIKVVNNSWGSGGPFDPDDPINEATREVHARGITVVFSAGNDGPGENTLNTYSVAPWVIGVAAGCKLGPDPTNSQNQCMRDDGSNPLEPTDNEPREHVLADFSSRGIPGDPQYHPDVTAPGVRIVSARASTGTVINALDVNRDLRLCAISIENEPFYTCASGTSMSAPHVSGVVALMQEAAGGTLTPDQVLRILTSTAQPLAGYAVWEVGAGYVDALAAVEQAKR
ncbi:MAG: S8 family serine peptidase [Gemmatimonadales bacterium]